MESHFRQYLSTQHMASPGDRILLAVSGGIDSVVMTELFHRAGFEFAIAHCNFGLRGTESDGDEQFVAGLAKKYHAPFFSTRFATAREAKKKNISIQMAARDLRYEWFEKIRRHHGFDLIATGHHLDDQIETFFINLLRGTGITGLHGILPRNGKVIRPLLFASRDEIEAFVRKNRLSYREDNSNKSVKYLRNRIRLELVPLLKDLNPEFISTMDENISRFREAAEIYKQKIGEVSKRLIRKRGPDRVIPLHELTMLEPLTTWVYEIFSPFGVNEPMAGQIATVLKSAGKKEFLTAEWKVVKDREEVVLTQRTRRGKEGHKEEYRLKNGSKMVRKPVLLSIRESDFNAGDEIPAGREFATLDADKLEFPLILRRWKPGDAFCPFGMNRKKKISDFFTDNKVSAQDKEQSWILWSGEKVAWVVGHRPDHRFRVTSRTKRILRIKYTKGNS